MKIKCTECKQIKPSNSFHSDKSKPNRKASRCKKCNNIHAARWYRNNKAVVQNLQFNRRYGISSHDVADIHSRQHGVCAICGEPPSDRYKKLHVDHCHETGRVRGLLCHECNHGLGKFKDDLDILASATSYLINSRLKEVAC